jgi:hypothetical protein
MSRNYIDFISAYCDSWCERCAFTERCSHFAVKSALAMCDSDFNAAIELAIGPARVPGAKPQKPLEERMADALGDYEEPTQKELDEIGREMDQRDARTRRHPLAESSKDYSVAAHRWLDAARHPAIAGTDALAVVQWDVFLIHVKTVRALNGRDEYPRGAPFERSAVQSDWNGSAKVALISIERSERAWREIAAMLHDEAATVLADSLATLRSAMRAEFPRAMEFRRPGFDTVRPGR